MPERTEYPAGMPNWVDLNTTDPAAAKQFYTGLFGWTYDDQPMSDEGAYSLAQIDGKDVAAISPMPPGSDGIPTHWNSYVSVPDVEATVGLVEGAGGTVVMPPFDVMDAGRMAIVQDPTGAMINVWQAKNHAGARLVNDPNMWSWNELLTPDVPKAGEFYAKVFGWTVHPVPDGSYTEFKLNGDSIAGAQNPPMPFIPPAWTVYFAVDDTDAMIEKIKAGGGALFAGPIDIPIGRLAVAADPQGGMFNVIRFNR